MGKDYKMRKEKIKTKPATYRLEVSKASEVAFIKKITGISFPRWVGTDGVDRFLKLYGKNKSLFEALSICSCCGNKLDFEQNFFLMQEQEEPVNENQEYNLSSNEKEEQTEQVFRVICPYCKERISQTDKNKLNSTEIQIKDDLFELSDYNNFYSLIQNGLSSNNFQSIEKGVVKIKFLW